MQELQKCIMHNQILLITILERLGLDKEELILLNDEVTKIVEKEFENTKEKSDK
ncbi:MAG TPA: hypothetical protein IAC14_08835 [Candidatus Scybalomonas excrementigallinarum]|nr:hypothetical protein [Candidatus Scybalomonas excrementigallinarum]